MNKINRDSTQKPFKPNASSLNTETYHYWPFLSYGDTVGTK